MRALRASVTGLSSAQVAPDPEAEREALKARNAALTEEIQEAEARLSEVRGALEKAKKQSEQLHTKLEKSRSEWDAIRSSLVKAQIAKDAGQTEFQRFDDQKSEATREIAEASSYLPRLDDSIAAFSLSNQCLQASPCVKPDFKPEDVLCTWHIAGQAASIAEFAKGLLETHLERITAKNAVVLSEIEGFKAERSHCEKEIGSLGQQKAELERLGSEARQKLLEAKTQLEEMRNKVSELAVGLSATELEISSSREALEAEASITGRAGKASETARDRILEDITGTSRVAIPVVGSFMQTLAEQQQRQQDLALLSLSHSKEIAAGFCLPKPLLPIFGPEVSPPPEVFTFRDGCRIRISGLQGKPEHNGKTARVVNFATNLQKYVVQLEDGSGRTVLMTESHMSPFTEDGKALDSAPSQ